MVSSKVVVETVGTAIKTVDLTKRYDKLLAVDHINFEVKRGENIFGPFVNVAILVFYVFVFLFVGIRFHIINQRKE